MRSPSSETVVCPACSVLELVLLYRGEVTEDGAELTRGTRSPALLHEVCRVAEPLTALSLFGLVYPGWTTYEIPVDEQLVLRRAFQAWQEGRTR